MKVERTFRPIDVHFARLMNELAAQPGPELELAAKLASFASGLGHICLPLDKLRESGVDFPAVGMPPLPVWRERLKASAVVGSPGEFAPLILDQKDRLYLRRYWEYEHKVASEIRHRMQGSAEDIDRDLLEKGLTKMFGVEVKGQINWQRIAASTAVTKRFCVISGGPGTGKTRTAVLILALLLEQTKGRDLRVALCAPTGKAAARLKESIQTTQTKIDLSAEITERLPDEATTIHRLLGVMPNSPYFRHNAGKRLPFDVVVVDEASMVDLALLSKLLEATSPSARVILLGDKDQLASVEAGAVLGDICQHDSAMMESKDGAEASIVELKENYRFGRDSEIFRLSRTINVGDANAALKILEQNSSSDLRWKESPRRENFKAQLKPIVLEHFSKYLNCRDPLEALEVFGKFRILCALRSGPFGVAGLNSLIEEILADERLIDPRNRAYAGRPLMITRNDHQLKLFNGDIGLLLPDPQTGGELRAYFPSAETDVHRVLPSRLPLHETAFAMTVHKSQGSEFENVLFVLPDYDSPVLTRELLYTGITRARKQVELWMNAGIGRSVIGKRIDRTSGLRDLLWDTAGEA